MDFKQHVLERSHDLPVLVDFWAPWCGPCRVLGPVLDQLAAEQEGRWELVKVNTEEEPEIGEQYRIMSIPNVKLFYKGEEIADFVGALPKTSIEQWLDANLPDPRKKELERLLGQLGGIDNDLVVEELAAFVQQYPDYKVAKVALANQWIFQKPAAAVAILEDIKMGDPLVEAAEDIRILARLMQVNGTEHPAGQALANARAALLEGHLEQAIQEVIRATTVDKSYAKDLPRRAAIALFRRWGKKHELTKNYRRQFDMALY